MRWVWILAWVAAAATAGAMYSGAPGAAPRSKGGCGGRCSRWSWRSRFRAPMRRPPGPAGWGRVRKHLRGDRVFIVVYAVLYSLLGGLLARRTGGGWRLLALAAIACAVATGVLDVLDNARIAALVSAPAGGSDRQPLVDAMRAASLRKWAAFFLTVALLGAALWRAGGARKSVAGLYLLVALMGAAGPAGPRAWIEWGLDAGHGRRRAARLRGDVDAAARHAPGAPSRSPFVVPPKDVRRETRSSTARLPPARPDPEPVSRGSPSPRRRRTAVSSGSVAACPDPRSLLRRS